MAEKKAGKAVAKKEEAPVAEYQYDAEDYGAGFEDFGRDDLAIPFINILQKMSPQVDSDHQAHIEGAKAGMLINSVTGELFDGKEEGVIVIPVHRTHNFVEWVPRDEGGGFVATYEVDDPVIVEAKRGGAFGKLEHPETENDLVETFSVYALVVNEEGDSSPVVIPFTSTQIKNYRKWMTTCRSVMLRDPSGRKFPAPMYAHLYRITTQFQENNKGTWHGFKINFAEGTAADSRLAPDSELFQAAKNFRELILSGAAKANYASVAQDDEGDGDSDEGGAEKPW